MRFTNSNKSEYILDELELIHVYELYLIALLNYYLI